MLETGHIIGIDLGTTNSVVAVLEGEQPTVIHNAEGSTRTPSVVAFLPSGEIVAGEIARRQGAVSPHSTITSIKRLMGRTLADVERLGLTLPYDLVEHERQLMVRIGNAGYTPQQVSAFILKKLKQAAEDYLGEPVTKAIITVPAYFDDLQRQATAEAGQLAGLEVLRLINEPTAAAMAYGLGRGGHERVAVYDFGGGTFDITVLDISDNTFEVLASAGDTQLGGDDIDQMLMDFIQDDYRAQTGHELVLDAMGVRRLKDAAEQAKCELSVARQAVIHLPFLAMRNNEPLHLERVIRVEEFERLIFPLVERTISICTRTLADADLRTSDLDRVILVGGSTRIPLVQDLVEEFFGIHPFKGINPDEIVAMGAATQAGVLGGKLKEVILLDVTPHSLGVELADHRVSRVIDKNSTIPIKAAKVFTTTEDDQEVVIVHVLQGEGEKSFENRSLGKFALSGLQRAKAGVPRIQVTFHINANGMVEVSAEDLVTRESKTVSVSLAGEDESSGTRRRKGAVASGGARRRRLRTPTPAAGEVIAARDAGGSVVRERVPTLRVNAAPGHFEPVRSGRETALASHALDLRTNNVLSMRPSPSPAGTPVPTAPDQQDDANVPTERLGADGIVQAAAIATPVPSPAIVETAIIEELSEAARDALKRIGEGSASPESLAVYRQAAAELSEVACRNMEQTAMAEAVLRIFMLTGDLTGARKLLARALESPAAKASDVAAMFNFYLAEHPEDDSALAWRADLAARRGDMDQAVADYERLCADDRGTDAQVEKLADLYQAKLAAASREDPETQFKLVMLLVRRNRVDEAINHLQRLTRNETYKARALKILGLCFWQKGLHYLAWQKFQQLPLTEEVKDILLRLSGDMENTEQYLNAKCVLDHLHENDPSYRDVKDRLARVQRLVEQQAESTGRSAHLSSVFVAFRDSRFIILEEINRGSMGIVYRAKDKILDEPVALKVLTDHLASDPAAVERFKREARAAKRLSHPNIVRIHDMFEIGNKKLLSMEYIDGKDVKKILLERKTLPAKEIVSIVRSVCDALAYAHKQGIVHRDIKPANIMITHDGLVKVTDFGIAKFLLAGADATRSGSQILGTPLYMSPEQIRGERVDERSDIYSLGAMMYEMITGRPPFWEGNIEYHHLHTEPQPMDNRVPPAMASIVLKCLAKAPADRFQSIEELYLALLGIT